MRLFVGVYAEYILVQVDILLVVYIARVGFGLSLDYQTQTIWK